METNRSTENITVIPADLYDEINADAPGEPDENLRAAAKRAREVIVHK
jgi:hypothetical protein